LNLKEDVSMTELLMFLKADALLRGHVGVNIVSDMLRDDRVQILSFQRTEVDGELIGRHYAHVKQRAFYPWLVDYITIAPVYAALLNVDAAHIDGLREHLGSTISQKATAGTVRHTYGIYGGINCLHVSDSVEGGKAEVALWKAAVGLSEGKFDIQPDQFVSKGAAASTPNNTQQLRDVCGRIEKTRVATQDDVTEIVELLRQECLHATETELYRLAETVIVSGLR
jgi:nucleoside-diphosphate kinase